MAFSKVFVFVATALSIGLPAFAEPLVEHVNPSTGMNATVKSEDIPSFNSSTYSERREHRQTIQRRGRTTSTKTTDRVDRNANGEENSSESQTQ